MTSGIRFPSRGSRETYKALSDMLAQYNIRGDFVWFKRHPAIMFEVAGHPHTIPFAINSSDVKSAKRKLVAKLRSLNLSTLKEDSAMDKITHFDREDEPNFGEIDQTSHDGGSETSGPVESAEQTVQSSPVNEPAIPSPSEPPMTGPTAEQQEWDERLVRFATARQLLYVPPPERPVILLEVERDLMIPKGHFLSIDPVSGVVTHITPTEAARYRPSPRNSSRLPDALTICAAAAPETEEIAPVAASPVPMTEPPPPPLAPSPVYPRNTDEPPSDEIEFGRSEEPPPSYGLANRRFTNSETREFGPIAPQPGRLLVIMECLRRITGSNRFDTRTLGEHLDPPDQRSIGPSMSVLRKYGLVEDAGIMIGNGRAKYYRLTNSGRRLAAQLGEVPFVAANKSPTPLLVQASRARRRSDVELEMH